jgi:hypothetical protein
MNECILDAPLVKKSNSQKDILRVESAGRTFCTSSKKAIDQKYGRKARSPATLVKRKLYRTHPGSKSTNYPQEAF